MCGSPFVIFIDGLDMMEKTHQPYNLEWLPRNLPKVWEQFYPYSYQSRYKFLQFLLKNNQQIFFSGQMIDRF